ncbi:hypothetical protein ACJ3XI_01870 [Litorimonas sp. RW-G-Af-16]|uniref:tellurite resistance TerB family protein n=1 Tax=Litorimonas sp. RW-G-Af-16 TaxID=3241168 RepID=UPI00390C5E7C
MAQSTPDNWQHIMTLMACVIASDHTVSDAERERFVTNVRQLADVIDPNNFYEDDTVRRWFTAKIPAIIKDMHSPLGDLVVAETAMALDSFTQKRAVLDAMIDLSTLDGDFVGQEVEVVNLTAAYWDLSPVRSKT